jgi:hypothetical protein
MGDGGEDMQQMTAGTRVTAFRTESLWYTLYPVSHWGTLRLVYLTTLFLNLQTAINVLCQHLRLVLYFI